MSEVFPLSEPITVGGEEVTELTLRKPTVDMLSGTTLHVGADGGIIISADIVLKVFGKLANIPPSSVKQISGDDYMRMVEVYTRFFGQSQETGETSWPSSPGSTTGLQVN